ncbi:hypothetical protein UG55_102125 [Frankia sp. EI5c]|uniref:hypothetical protein n=1 Tax=Frankia sp. EI5c TaxID=683316 RepID=UPI0007C378AA|nr:hypothetical protein [Frankia sp. EI5c]OAA25591.1 hypothetical protein UG55_102125 [Frankia sp. EI5c]
MAGVLTQDDVDEIVFSAAGNGGHRQAAARFEDLAARPELHGEVSATVLLVHAGDQHGLAGSWDDAVRCYRAATALATSGDEAEIDPRVWLHDALMRRNRARAEAREQAVGLPASRRAGETDHATEAESESETETEITALRAEIKASRSANPDVYAAVAETLADHGRLQEAHTWFTMGFQRCEGADIPDYMLHLLLVGRRAVRRDLGYPPDELDRVADAYVDHLEPADEHA